MDFKIIVLVCLLLLFILVEIITIRLKNDIKKSFSIFFSNDWPELFYYRYGLSIEEEQSLLESLSIENEKLLSDITKIKAKNQDLDRLLLSKFDQSYNAVFLESSFKNTVTGERLVDIDPDF